MIFLKGASKLHIFGNCSALVSEQAFKGQAPEVVERERDDLLKREICMHCLALDAERKAFEQYVK